MKSSLRCCGIPTHEVEIVWERIAPLLEKAIFFSDGKYTVEQIKRFLLDKKMQLWLAVKGNHDIQAFCITQIVEYPNKKIMFIVFSAGISSIEWLHFINDLKDFAVYHQCQSIEIYGRKGWERKLKSFGYEPVHTVLRLNLSGA